VGFFSSILAVLAGLFGRQSGRHSRQVRYQALGESLEKRNSQSALSCGATVPDPSHHESGRSLRRAAEVHHLKVAETSLAGSTATTNPVPDDSGKLDPKDPGGIELVRTAASVKLDPKDPGGVELGWVDHAVVHRLRQN
jgi:hypothetical protein